MRTAIVNSRDLGKDWWAERHCPSNTRTLQHARKVGWERGAMRGSPLAANTYWRFRNGRPEVKAAFETAYYAGCKARKEFFKCAL